MNTPMNTRIVAKMMNKIRNDNIFTVRYEDTVFIAVLSSSLSTVTTVDDSQSAGDIFRRILVSTIFANSILVHTTIVTAVVLPALKVFC